MECLNWADQRKGNDLQHDVRLFRIFWLVDENTREEGMIEEKLSDDVEFQQILEWELVLDGADGRRLVSRSMRKVDAVHVGDEGPCTRTRKIRRRLG